MICPRLRDTDGFTTAGMLVALLVVLALIFSSAQVYRVMSSSADVQDVADASVLAAENLVSEYMIAVRVSDAIVLSLSLVGIATEGLGIAALCTPVTSSASVTLLDLGRKIFSARDQFAQKASQGLNQLQKALPYMAAVKAMMVVSANNGGVMNDRYVSVVFLSPEEGKDISIKDLAGATELCDDVEDQAESIQEAGKRAEEAARDASAAKQEAFERDCGDYPGYCMYERAETLAALPSEYNPLFHSVDTWSFSAAFDRAKAYYRQRADREAPEDMSVREQARSALRKRFYSYAISLLSTGFVSENGDSFEADIPALPKNTAEMRETILYTEAVYPVSVTESGSNVMHAWEGCPGAQNVVGTGSISQMERGNWPECPHCGFNASSMGNVGAASSSIDNGFEYHYNAVGDAARRYAVAKQKAVEEAAKVKEKTKSLFDAVEDLIKTAMDCRIDARPPGSYGAIALTANVSSSAASTGFQSSFVSSSGTLGPRAAVAGATIIEESDEEGATVISSFLDGVSAQAGGQTGIVGIMMDCWSFLLQSYQSGQEALDAAIENAVSHIPFSSESGLGKWASGVVSRLFSDVGLQPARLNALKPVLVNTSEVADVESNRFTSRFVSVKSFALSMPSSSSNFYASMMNEIERQAFDELKILDEDIQLATLQPFGEQGPSIPITIQLPPSVKESAEGMLGDAMSSLRNMVAESTGYRAWE